MHSPKFPHKSPHLRVVVNASDLQAIWKNAIRARMRAQLLPDAVEYLDFHVNLSQRTAEIEALVCGGQYVPGRAVRMLSEKSRGLCRQMVLPEPEDVLILQALSNALWKTIQAKAPCKTAFYAPQDQPFSKVNKSGEDDEWGYGPIDAWLDFQKSILGFQKFHKFIVVTDIANYYDSVVHQYLRSVLSDLGREREIVLDLLVYMLSGMLWAPDYMPNIGIGLPQMDFDAPRLLAHSILFEIDEIFGTKADISYARFMDDIDFGVDTIAKGRQVLRDLDLALQTRNLRLNSGKTKILNLNEAALHFRVVDNKLIDAFDSRLKSNSTSGRYQSIYRKVIKRSIYRGIRTSRFDGGNGEKILKRLLTRAKNIKSGVDTFSLRYVLWERPALRQYVLKAWTSGPRPLDQINDLIDFLHSGNAVDDLSKVLGVISIIDGVYSKRVKTSILEALLSAFDHRQPFDLWCRLIIISRFSSLEALMREIEDTKGVWPKHRFLVRTVAGFFGLFRGRALFVRFERFSRRFGGPEAVVLMDFHETLATPGSGYSSVSSFLRSESPSVASRISYAKTLMICTVLNNPAVSKVVKTQLLAKHQTMMTDVYYLRRYSRILSSLP